MNAIDERAKLVDARRIVVKLGSRILVQRNGRPDMPRLSTLVQDVVQLRKAGRDVVMVSSGAIAAGVEALNLKTRPKELQDLQMAAAVGQSRLMTIYDQLFSKYGYRVGQILLTYDDLKNRSRHVNVRNTITNLLRHDIIPIINENDVVTTEELKFGDNDQLASLVALLIQADLLIMLTSVDGFREPAGAGRTRRVSVMAELTPEILSLAKGKGSEFSTGGMASKLRSAEMVARVGAPVIIARGREDNILQQVVRGDDVGTLLKHRSFTGNRTLEGRKLWLAYFEKTDGAVVVDDGAAEALTRKGRSLLPIGVRAVEGTFPAGSLVEIKNLKGTVVARGLVEYDAADILKIMGHKTAELPTLLSSAGNENVIHRDNLVVLAKA